MIVQQELDGGGTKGSHLRWCVPLPLIIGVRLHAKLGVPSLTDPGLLLVEQPRNAIVLHPRQMPGQPGNRIGVMTGLTMNFVNPLFVLPKRLLHSYQAEAAVVP